MTEFTINRENWATGSNGYSCDNHLLNEDGTMCCLGFFCNRVARIKKENLLNVYDPQSLNKDFLNKKSLSGLVKIYEYRKNENTSICDSLMTVNDSKEIGLKEREKEVSRLFKELGYKVNFIGKYAKRKRNTKNNTED